MNLLESGEGFSGKKLSRVLGRRLQQRNVDNSAWAVFRDGTGGCLGLTRAATLVHLRSKQVMVTALSSWRCVRKYICLCKAYVYPSLRKHRRAMELPRGNHCGILQWWDSSSMREGTMVSGGVTRGITQERGRNGAAGPSHLFKPLPPACPSKSVPGIVSPLVIYAP